MPMSPYTFDWVWLLFVNLLYRHKFNYTNYELLQQLNLRFIQGGICYQNHWRGCLSPRAAEGK